MRYEDLVQDTGRVLAVIQTHLGVPVENLVEQRKENRYWHKILKTEAENIHGHWKFNPLYSSISPSGIGSHKKSLDPNTIDEFMKFNAGYLNYTLPENSFRSIQEMMDHLEYQ